MDITISDVLQETSPSEGTASSGYFPATGTCSASPPAEISVRSQGFAQAASPWARAPFSTCLAIFIPYQIFTSFETFRPLARWIGIG